MLFSRTSLSPRCKQEGNNKRKMRAVHSAYCIHRCGRVLRGSVSFGVKNSSISKKLSSAGAPGLSTDASSLCQNES